MNENLSPESSPLPAGVHVSLNEGDQSVTFSSQKTRLLICNGETPYAFRLYRLHQKGSPTPLLKGGTRQQASGFTLPEITRLWDPTQLKTLRSAVLKALGTPQAGIFPFVWKNLGLPLGNWHIRPNEPDYLAVLPENIGITRQDTTDAVLFYALRAHERWLFRLTTKDGGFIVQRLHGDIWAPVFSIETQRPRTPYEIAREWKSLCSPPPLDFLEVILRGLGTLAGL